MKFFFDANVSHRLAAAMGLLDEDISVTHQRDQFPQNTPDEELLKYVGQNEMVFVTRDRKIIKRRAEFLALKKYGVGAFFLIGKNLDKWQQIKQLIWAWQEMKRLAEITRRPYAFQVRSQGKVLALNLGS
ncbi:MAG: DUF5615 family PIN-like protein [Candidatus Aminicenantales bacterium]